MLFGRRSLRQEIVVEGGHSGETPGVGIRKNSRVPGAYNFLRKNTLLNHWGLPLSAVARPAQQVHTSGVSSGLLYHPPRAPPVRDKPFSQSPHRNSQRTAQLNDRSRTVWLSILPSGTPYTRDEMGPELVPPFPSLVQPCLENRTHIAQRPRTYTQPTQPPSC